MKKRIFLLLPAILLIPSASMGLFGKKKNDHRPEITLEEITEILSAPALSAREVTITTRLVEPDGTEGVLPTITTRIGQEASVKRAKEFIFPTDYDLPKVQALTGEEDAFPVGPTTPTRFETAEVGDFLTVTPTLRGSLIELEGTLTKKTADATTIAGGEAHSPYITYEDRSKVVITENKAVAPEFQRTDSTVRICGRPGVEHEMRLNVQNRRLIVRVDIDK